MKSAPLPPIPIPRARRLRIARERLVPVTVFVLVWSVIALLWREEVAPLSVVGEVEIVKADIMPVQAGMLSRIAVEPFQTVEAGDVVAVVARTDPAALAASVAVIRAELNLLATNLDPVIARQRADIDYERLRVELANRRLDQAQGKIQLEQARLDFARAERLHTQGILPEVDKDAARLARDLLVSGVEGRAGEIAALEGQLARLALPEAGARTRAQAVDAATAVQERRIEELESTLGPLALTAPIRGRIGRVLRRPGETVMAGEIITTITSETGGRIVAYLRPPPRQDVTPGMQVVVRSRSGRRPSTVGVIEGVDPHFSTFPLELQEEAARRAERAVVFSVGVPADFSVRPGELLDLSLPMDAAR